jgi:hypothetical protein
MTRPLDALDHRMIRIAAERGTVLVRLPSGEEVPATLVAWLPSASRRGRCCRVQFASGRQRTLQTWEVRPPQETSPQGLRTRPA